MNLAFRIAGLTVLWAALGCASEAANNAAETDEGGIYEGRLKATAGEFAYYELLNQNLTRDRFERMGISLRVPKPFRSLETAAPDASVPDVASSGELLGVPLPGVLGVWQAGLPGKDGAAPQSAWLFLMSNHHLLGTSPAAARTFHQTLVEKVLVHLPGLEKLPIESNWQTENWTGHGLPFTSANFPATFAKTGQPAEFAVFLMHYGDNDRRNEIKASLLFVVPQSAELAGSRPDANPMRLSAETVRIDPQAGEKT